MARRRRKQTADTLSTGRLLKRTGEPDDIARTVSFLIADAPYISGRIIAVDGERSLNL